MFTGAGVFEPLGPIYMPGQAEEAYRTQEAGVAQVFTMFEQSYNRSLRPTGSAPQYVTFRL